jgi:hypothetical protein
MGKSGDKKPVFHVDPGTEGLTASRRELCKHGMKMPIFALFTKESVTPTQYIKHYTSYIH